MSCFYAISRMRIGFLAFLLLVSALVFSTAQDKNINDYSSLENRARSLSQRLNAHEALIAEILSRPDPISPKPSTPTPPSPQIDPPASQSLESVAPPGFMPGGRLPAPQYDQSQDSDTSTPTPVSQWEQPDVSLRNNGYYLGLIGASVLPLDGAVRWGGGMGGASMQFEKGYLAGVLMGRDFGFIRVESEHNTIHYDQKNGSGSAAVHPVLFRCIFEKEIGDRVDLRAGIGSGISLAQLNYAGKVFGGMSFCYDFLLGAGIRLNEALALNLDYRYFLTAASEDFKRLQSNLLTASLQFDL